MACLLGVQRSFHEAEVALLEVAGWALDEKTIRQLCHATAARAAAERAGGGTAEAFAGAPGEPEGSWGEIGDPPRRDCSGICTSDRVRIPRHPGDAAMDFPLTDLLDQDACYHKLLAALHPDGLTCPSCQSADQLHVHRRHRAPVLDDRCAACGRAFNAFTGTALEGTHRRPAEILLIVRGIGQGVPTARLARELGCDRKHLRELRHRLQGDARRWLGRDPLPDRVVETDEMDPNAGAKGIEHPGPADPPRRRADGRRGNFANDRPPVVGAVGRHSGEVRLEVVGSAGAEELGGFVDGSCRAGATVNTDEWRGYSRVGGHQGRIHVSVDHSGPKGTWALDADGDGVREVHCHTMEGIWTGLRNFLRPFRGVSKWSLEQYVAMFQWGHNLKEVTDGVIRVMLGVGQNTGFAP
jgi:transposase